MRLRPLALVALLAASWTRRAATWEMREIVFQFQDQAVVERFAREVMPALRS